MNKTEATPRPWRADEEEYSQYIYGPSNEMICEMRGWGYLTGTGGLNLSDKDAMEIQHANNQLIVKAVNNYDRLVEALEVLINAVGTMHKPEYATFFIDGERLDGYEVHEKFESLLKELKK